MKSQRSDESGSDLVPDYLTSVRDGGFYGWPYSYYGSHVDERVKPQRPNLVSKALAPDYALGAHTASLGLAFAEPGLSLSEDGKARGRPVGVIQDRRGALLVADDVGNVIWRVTGTARAPG